MIATLFVVFAVVMATKHTNFIVAVKICKTIIYSVKLCLLYIYFNFDTHIMII